MRADDLDRQAPNVAGQRANRPALEPEQPAVEPPAGFPREAFFDGGLGLLVEQGQIERARVLLAQRATRNPHDPTLYLDAIRAERTAAPNASAWQAWLARALRQRLPVAAEARRLVPAGELRAFLAGGDVSLELLAQQADTTAARDLLRLRLEGLLLRGTEHALAELEPSALAAEAARDPERASVVAGALAACAFEHPERVERLLARCAPDTAAASFGALRRVLALAADWQRVVQRAEPPPALGRLVALGPVLSRVALLPLVAAATRELAAQPRSYLRCADAVAQSRALHAELLAGAAARAPARPLTSPDAAQRCLRAIDAALGRSASRFAWWGSLLACLGIAVGAGLLLGARALYAAPLLALLVPLRGALDRIAYRHGARAALAHAIARDGLAPEALASAVRTHPRRRVRSLARFCARDPGLALLAAWAGAGGSGSAK